MPEKSSSTFSLSTRSSFGLLPLGLFPLGLFPLGLFPVGVFPLEISLKPPRPLIERRSLEAAFLELTDFADLKESADPGVWRAEKGFKTCKRGVRILNKSED